MSGIAFWIPIRVILLSFLLAGWTLTWAIDFIDEYEIPSDLADVAFVDVTDGRSSLGQEVSGNLLNIAYEEAKKGEFVLIVHGCNCFGFGSGLSGQLNEYLPEAELIDQKSVRGDRSKLGRYTSVDVIRNGITFKVINAYTQYQGGEEKQQNLERSIKSVFRKIAKDFPEYKIYYPAIGCGITGGEWNKIHPVIKRALKGRDFTFVRYNPDEAVRLPRPVNDVKRKSAVIPDNEKQEPWHQSTMTKVVSILAVIKVIAATVMSIVYKIKQKEKVDPYTDVSENPSQAGITKTLEKSPQSA